MSIVKLENRIKNVLSVSELDILDNTPLIDIKPYIPRFDFRKNASDGWTGSKEIRDKPKNRE
jgi:tRNA (Thr-GGU) A37 N-methylase